MATYDIYLSTFEDFRECIQETLPSYTYEDDVNIYLNNDIDCGNSYFTIKIIPELPSLFLDGQGHTIKNWSSRFNIRADERDVYFHSYGGTRDTEAGVITLPCSYGVNNNTEFNWFSCIPFVRGIQNITFENFSYTIDGEDFTGSNEVPLSLQYDSSWSWGNLSAENILKTKLTLESNYVMFPSWFLLTTPAKVNQNSVGLYNVTLKDITITLKNITYESYTYWDEEAAQYITNYSQFYFTSAESPQIKLLISSNIEKVNIINNIIDTSDKQLYGNNTCSGLIVRTSFKEGNSYNFNRTFVDIKYYLNPSGQFIVLYTDTRKNTTQITDIKKYYQIAFNCIIKSGNGIVYPITQYTSPGYTQNTFSQIYFNIQKEDNVNVNGSTLYPLAIPVSSQPVDCYLISNISGISGTPAGYNSLTTEQLLSEEYMKENTDFYFDKTQIPEGEEDDYLLWYYDIAETPPKLKSISVSPADLYKVIKIYWARRKE